MVKLLKRLIPVMLILCLTIPAQAAGTANDVATQNMNVPVTLNAESMRFSASVPTVLPVNVDTAGVVTTSSNVKIVNNSVGPITISNVSIVGSNDWEIIGYDTSVKGLKVGSKQFGMILNNDKTVNKQLQFNSTHWPTIDGLGEQKLVYNAILAPQKEKINESIANCIFTVGWDLRPEVEVIRLTGDEMTAMGYTFAREPNNTIYLQSYTGKEKDIVIPSYVDDIPVTALGNNLFAGNSLLTSLEIPETVTSIGSGAVQNCTNLERVILTKNITTIHSGAFASNGNLKTIKLPSKLSMLGSSAFSRSGLTEIIIPGSLTKIEESTFASCNNLTSVVIQEGVQRIGEEAFNSCRALQSVTLPSSLTDMIERTAFFNCDKLDNVIIPDKLGNIGENAFWHVKHIYYNGSAQGSPWGALAIN